MQYGHDPVRSYIQVLLCDVRKWYGMSDENRTEHLEDCVVGLRVTFGLIVIRIGQRGTVG